MLIHLAYKNIDSAHSLIPMSIVALFYTNIDMYQIADVQKHVASIYSGLTQQINNYIINTSVHLFR